MYRYAYVYNMLFIFQTPSIIKYNTTYFSAENIMNFVSKLDKNYDLPISIDESSVLKELNLLLSNLKLKINGGIDLFDATIKVSI